MKTRILLLFSLFLVTGSIQAQKGKFNFVDSDIKKGLNILPGQSSFIQIDTNFNLLPNLDLFNKKKCQKFDLIKFDIFQKNLKINPPIGYAVAEEFPGASIYYAKRPSLLEMTNENYFVIKPDTTAIYFLIINGHLDHRIIK